jgi:hypothetical protein
VQISPYTGQNFQLCLILAFENIENITWYDTVFETYKLTFLEITLTIIIRINGPSLPPANSASPYSVGKGLQGQKKKTPWPESVSELYQPSDRC